MFRREFLAFSAGAVPGSPIPPPTIESALRDLRAAVATEMPDVVALRIYYDPSEPTSPLIITAMRG